MEAFLGILLKKKLLPNAKIDENRACAAYGLGLMGAEEALPHLSKFLNSSNKLLREISGDAMKRIENEIQKPK